MIHRHLVRLVSLAALAMLPCASASAGEPIPLTGCGQEVRGGTYYLTGDLDCTGQPGHGIAFLRRGRLELRGFTLSNAELHGVECTRCDVVGPGSILNSGGIGIRPARKARITDVTVAGSGTTGIEGGTLLISDSRIEGSRWGVFAGRKARVINTIITANERAGLRGPTPTTDCRGGMKLEGSDVSGNGTSPDCGVLFDDCFDLVSCRSPRIDEDSTCGTSSSDPPGSSWGVCALD